MKNKLSLFLVLAILIFISSCSNDEDILPESELSEYELNVISYFKDVALGFEFGNASEIIRKWNSEMKVFIGGEPTTELLSEVENIKNEINNLITDGFTIEIVNDSIQSNFYIFFGIGNNYANLYPSQSS